MRNLSRAPKLIGDFGEGLATYALIKSQYEVAYVDHVGADLIAEKNGNRIAVSVKTRNRNTDTKESDMVVIKDADIEKLNYFSEKFRLAPVFCQIICQEKYNTIHMFMITVQDIQKMDKCAQGYSLYFSSDKLDDTKAIQGMKYSQWSNESINVV